jgi:hypothetical protein
MESCKNNGETLCGFLGNGSGKWMVGRRMWRSEEVTT